MGTRTKTIVANTSVTIFYDKIIPAGRYIENGAVKPDVVIWNKQETSEIIDIMVPKVYSMNRTEREKLTKSQE